jgi:acetyltransferase-like isoleucine patch superfamily enzyme
MENDDRYIVKQAILQTLDKPKHKVVLLALGAAVAYIMLIPAFLLWKTKLFRYRTFTTSLAMIPSNIGVIFRRVWYLHTLDKCGENLHVEWMAWIRSNKTTVGDHVQLGIGAIVGMAHLGDYVGIAPGCIVLSGLRMHDVTNPDLPYTVSPGVDEFVEIGDYAWCLTRSVVGAHVGAGSIVGAGTVIMKPVPDHVLVVGAKAQIIKELPKKSFEK